jgi:hypothetical protein
MGLREPGDRRWRLLVQGQFGAVLGEDEEQEV